MARSITFQRNSLTLAGRVLKENKTAPDFRVVSGDLKEVKLSDLSGKIRIITSFPSIDTPVCDLQVKEFNKKATSLSDEVMVIGISKDLPFAQKRFCQANNIDRVKVLSDYKTTSFGINYGLLIKELNLLARAVLIVDKNNTLRYTQIVKELTHPPDYAEVLKNLEEILKNPAIGVEQELPAKCRPCEGGTPLLPMATVDRLLAQHRGWELVEDKKLKKEYKFKDFPAAKYFLDLISTIAEEQDHHPTMTLAYNKVRVTLTTHIIGGLTENDFIMAGIIDEIGGS